MTSCDKGWRQKDFEGMFRKEVFILYNPILPDRDSFFAVMNAFDFINNG